MLNRNLEDVRECLYGEKSLAGWTELQEMAKQAFIIDPEKVPLIIGYAEESLDAWPSHLRKMTKEQLIAALTDQDSFYQGMGKLARTVDIRLNADGMPRKIRPNNLRNLDSCRHVSISSGNCNTLRVFLNHFGESKTLESLGLNVVCLPFLADETRQALCASDFGENLRDLEINVSMGTAANNRQIARGLSENTSLGSVRNLSLSFKNSGLVLTEVMPGFIASDLCRGLDSLHFFTFGDGVSASTEFLMESGFLSNIPNLGLRVFSNSNLDYLASDCHGLRHLTIDNDQYPFASDISGCLEIPLESLDFSSAYNHSSEGVTNGQEFTRRSQTLNCFTGLKRLRLDIRFGAAHIETIFAKNPDIEDLEIRMQNENSIFRSFHKLKKLKRLKIIGLYNPVRCIDIAEIASFDNLEVIEIDSVGSYKILFNLVVAALKSGTKKTIVCHGESNWFHDVAYRLRYELARSSVRFIYVPKNMY